MRSVSVNLLNAKRSRESKLRKLESCATLRDKGHLQQTKGYMEYRLRARLMLPPMAIHCPRLLAVVQEPLCADSEEQEERGYARLQVALEGGDPSRLLKQGGQLLFTDPFTVTGPLTNAEISVRSSSGFDLFVPPDYNERVIEQCGLQLLVRKDLTANMAEVAERRGAARASRSTVLRIKIKKMERREDR